MIRATTTKFTPDLALQLRAPTAGATDEVYSSPAIALNKLQAHWTTNEWGVAKRLKIAIGLKDIAVSAEQAYEFVAQVDALDSFGSPITVSRVIVQGVDIPEDGIIMLAVDVEAMALFDANAGYLRIVMTPSAGRDQATIVISDFLASDAEFTLDDGTNGAESVKVGTAEVGTVTFDAVATAGLIITIDDGVNAPVAFEYGVGAGLILVGADANASAANLRAAILAAVAAGDLDVGVASASDNVVTITNLAGVTSAIFTDSAITETADPGSDTTVATFANGEAGAVQPQAIIEHNGGNADTQRDQVVAAIEALASGSFQAVRDGNTILVTNTAPELGVSEGEALEVADSGNDMTVNDFAVAAASIDFWAYVASGVNPH